MISGGEDVTNTVELQSKLFRRGQQDGDIWEKGITQLAVRAKSIWPLRMTLLSSCVRRLCKIPWAPLGKLCLCLTGEYLFADVHVVLRVLISTLGIATLGLVQKHACCSLTLHKWTLPFQVRNPHNDLNGAHPMPRHCKESFKKSCNHAALWRRCSAQEWHTGRQ